MFSAWHRHSCRCIRPKARRVHIHKAENSAAPERVATTDLFHVSQRKTWAANCERRTANVFPQHRRFASFSPFFFPAEPAKGCEIAAQRLRKNSCTAACAKDA